MGKNKSQKSVFHCTDLFAALNTSIASKDFSRLFHGIENEKQYLEIFNKLKSSNLEGISEDEYQLFLDFLRNNTDINLALNEYLQDNYTLHKKRNFGDIAYNLLIAVDTLLHQSRIIGILQNISEFGENDKKYQFQKYHQEPVEIISQKKSNSIVLGLRSRKYYIYNNQELLFKTSEKITFAEHPTLEQFGVFFQSENDFILIHNNKTLKISKKSEFVVTRTGGLFIIDKDHNIFFNFDVIHLQCTQQSFTGTSIIQTFKKLNISLLEDSSIAIKGDWGIANVKLYDYEKNQILLQYLHPQDFKLENKKFYCMSYDKKAFYIYDGNEILSYNQIELSEMRDVPELFRPFIKHKKEA